jgi:hypothetical protein
MDLYSISRDVELDGVIAVDQQAIGSLIQALGPLQIDGYPKPITGQTVIETARQAWSQGKEDGGEWWLHRKDFMAAVLQATVRRLEGGLDQGTLYRLANAAIDALDGKHVQVYLAAEPAAALLAELGWDGAMLDRPGDYVMVVDTNMGFNKVNALVASELQYVVDLADLSRPRATLTVRHHHPLEPRGTPCVHEPRYDDTYEQMMERCYWDYLRVYVPLASTLVDASPHSVSGSELLGQRPSPAQVTVGPPEQGRNVFGTFLLVRPSETVETGFGYALPPNTVQVVDQRLEYELLVQKQAGTHAVPLSVELRLPDGMTLAKSEPEPASHTASVVEYSVNLETDLRLRATFAGHYRGP